MILSRLPNNIFPGVLWSVVKSKKLMSSTEPPNRDWSDQNQIKRSKLEQQISNQNFIIMQMMIKTIQQERRQRQAKEQQRFEREQKERKQRQAKEQQRFEREYKERRQRQAKEQQRIKKGQKFKLWAFTISSIVSFSGLFLAFVHYYFDYDPVERSRQNQMVKKSFQFPFDQNKYADSPLYDQTKKCIQQQLPSNRIKLVGGCSGAGKTTVAKRILKQLQKKGQQAYYFSFGDYTQIEKKERKNQFYWLIQGLKRKYKDGKKAKIIFDDINRLQAYHPQDFKFIMQDIYRLSAYPNINITCISSTGSFLTNQIEHQFWGALFKKAGKAFILQDYLLSGEAMKKFHIQVLKMNFKNKCQDNEKIQAFEHSGILQTIAELRMPTRKVVSIFQDDSLQLLQRDLSKKENIEKSIQQIKQKQRSYVEEFGTKIVASRPPSLHNQTFVSLLQKINHRKQKQLQFSTRSKILSEFNKDQAMNLLLALDMLDKNNIIIFCRPRSQAEAKALEIYIKQYADQKKRDSNKSH